MTNKSFLEYVARDIIACFGTNLAHTAVVFPNKRAALFFNQYLANISDRPMWSPAYITISDLFRKHSALVVADHIKLICDLHKSYNQCTGMDESLDFFYSWGEVMLADFDDLDKNEADPQKVFANLRDVHEMDSLDYLSEQQKDILKHFFANFNEEHTSRLKEKFIRLWSHLYDIYVDFNARLEQQGLTYEGALYRKVAQNKTIDFVYDRYIFVGFNVLQTVEKDLFTTLKEQNKAFFYWDYDRYFMAGNNEAGHYIRKHKEQFTNLLDDNDDDIYNNFNKEKQITYITAQTENIQARYISTWLRENNRYADGKKTAIILCDEKLLPATIHSIPPEVSKLNITTGYPLAQTPVASLISLLIALQVNGFDHNHERFRLHHVNAVLRHPYIKYLSAEAIPLMTMLNQRKIYYPDNDTLAKDEALALLFTSYAYVNADEYNGLIAQWILQIIKRIAQGARTENDALTDESLFRAYTLMNRISQLIASNDLVTEISTFSHLISQMISSTTVPFHGEPAEGVQIMGVLETRNLDFDHVLLLSCNEGNMPKGVNDTSLIPHSIRTGHELTTVDNKVAIYAYYFYSVIQRAKDVTIVYNNAVNDGQKGEMSRFMLQMMVESSHPIIHQTLQSGQMAIVHQPVAIAKTPTVMLKMRQLFDSELSERKPPLLTPTSINKYQRCQLQFFYNYISGIKEPDDNDEDVIDNRIFGNIFHEAANIIYTDLCAKSTIIQPEDINALLRHGVAIEMAVDKAFKIHLFKMPPDASFRMELNGLQLINRDVIIKYLRRLLENDKHLAPFSIIALEGDVMAPLTIHTPQGTLNTTIGGRIDRLDIVNWNTANEQIRVIDYKTGSKPQKIPTSIDEIFDSKDVNKHGDYYLQTILYALLVQRNKQYNNAQLPVSAGLLFIQSNGSNGYDPTLQLGTEKINDVRNFADEFRPRLMQVITDIFDSDKPFEPTDNKKVCKTCPYAQLCGL